MKAITLSLVTLCVVASLTSAFTPRPASSLGGVGLSPGAKFSTAKSTPGAQPLFGFMGDKERNKLTRDSEPEDFFRTNTDKMSDQEKIPIAIAGIAFIALPFIAGLIALYSAK